MEAGGTQGNAKRTVKSLDSMVRKGTMVLLVGDFNRKNVMWEEMKVNGNAGLCSEEMLQLAMVKTVDQWIEESTRYQGVEEPSILELVFTNEPEPRPTILKLNGKNTMWCDKWNRKMGWF